MKEITIISGKGGTGKTTLTAALATTQEKLVLCDGDVGAPDLHLILQPEVLESHVFEGSWLVSIDQDLCTQCGICAEGCPVGAIDSENSALIDTEKCITCCACIKNCPQNARTMKTGPVKDAAMRLNKLYKERKEAAFFF